MYMIWKSTVIVESERERERERERWCNTCSTPHVWPPPSRHSLSIQMEPEPWMKHTHTVAEVGLERARTVTITVYQYRLAMGVLERLKKGVYRFVLVIGKESTYKRLHTRSYCPTCAAQSSCYHWTRTPQTSWRRCDKACPQHQLGQRFYPGLQRSGGVQNHRLSWYTWRVCPARRAIWTTYHGAVGCTLQRGITFPTGRCGSTDERGESIDTCRGRRPNLAGADARTAAKRRNLEGADARSRQAGTDCKKSSITTTTTGFRFWSVFSYPATRPTTSDAFYLPTTRPSHCQ